MGRRTNGQARTGDYRYRVEVLRRAVGAKAANGKEVETWPDAGDGYSAARDGLTAGEQLTVGVSQRTGFMKLRVKGPAVPVATSDRVKLVATGELFRVTGVEREAYDTVLSVERVAGQEVGQ